MNTSTDLWDVFFDLDPFCSTCSTGATVETVQILNRCHPLHTYICTNAQRIWISARLSSYLLFTSCPSSGVGLTKRWPTRPGWTALTSCSQGRTSGRWTSVWHWPTATTVTSRSTSTRCKSPTRGPTRAPSRPITSLASPTSTSLSKVSHWLEMLHSTWH